MAEAHAGGIWTRTSRIIKAGSERVQAASRTWLSGSRGWVKVIHQPPEPTRNCRRQPFW
jgi:hypothetical protein